MGKGKTSKNSSTGEILGGGVNTYTAAKKESNSTLKKVGIWAAAIAIILFLVGMTTYQYLATNGFTEKRTVVLSTENYELRAPDLSYYFYSGYQNVYSMASYVGLDTTKPLTDQTCSIDPNGGTWYDYLANESKEAGSQMLALCEAAKAAGIELDDEDMKLIDDEINAIKTAADTAGYSVKDYIKNMYGPYTRESNLRHVFELSALATKYVNKVVEDADVSDSALEAYYADNKDDFTIASYLTYTFNYADVMPKETDSADGGDADAADSSTGDTTENEDKTSENAGGDSSDNDSDADKDNAEKTEAKNKIAISSEELAACTDAEAFKAYVKKYASEVLGKEEADVEAAVNNTVVTAKSKGEIGSDELLKWVFEEAEAGQAKSTSKDNGEKITVVLVTKAADRDTASLKNVRHILFSNEEYDDDTKVNEVYDKWVADGAKLEDFEALVKEYSADSNVDEGGLYEDVTRGAMVDPFDSWIFDETRKTGDHGIVKTTYGWHIMYFVGDSDRAVWQESVKTAIQSKARTDANETSLEAYPSAVNEKGLGMLAG